MKFFLFVTLAFFVECIQAQQTKIDTLFRVSVEKPIFGDTVSVDVLIDEAHNNHHRKESGLYSFTRMMEEDGAKVVSNHLDFSEESLSRFDLLIIANALNDINVGNWQNPCPSAFTIKEIEAVVNYVAEGGSLLLVADHMPYGGAVQDLAKEFGVNWSNSFVMQNGQKWPPSTFRKRNNTLLNSPVTIDTTFGIDVSFIASFTGSAFKIPKGAKPFLAFDDSHRLLLPEIAWRFSKKTKNEDATGWFQGACMKYGKGKIVFLGEAAMITAQISGATKVGMNSPDALENGQLALNIFRYLATN